MIGAASNPTGAQMLYSPTPMKRRSTKKVKSPRRHSKDKKDDFDADCSKRSSQDSLSSKLGSTVAMEDSESDSDYDNRSFFSDAFSAISELPEPLESETPHRSDVEEESAPKKRDKVRKKKKKKGKPDKKKKKKEIEDSPKIKKKKETEDLPKKKKKKEKLEKSKKKLDKSDKSPAQSIKDQKVASKKIHQTDSDDDSFLGEAFDGTHRVVPQILAEEASQDLPVGPPLWGDSEEEKSFGGIWEEDQSWNGWDENDDKSEYVEETLCDESNDGFSYYTIQSHENEVGMGFPQDEDIEEDDMSEWSDKSEVVKGLEKRRVCFNECEIIHKTLHICDFTKKEIRRSWYQQKDYEETIQGVKEVACNAETPRDTQTRFRKQRSLLSKTAETRGLEAWTPSGVQRFRYVKEAAFRAVWDEQQKQLERADSLGDDEDEDDDISSAIENGESLRQAYQRVSRKSQKEAQMRAKRDEEIAAKLQPRSKKRGGGRRGSWEKSMGNSNRRLLDGSNHGLSDNPAAPPTSCLRKQEDTSPIAQELSKSEHRRKPVWFGESARSLVRQKSDRGISTIKPDQGSLSMQGSDRSLFKKKSDRGLFRQSSDRSLFNKKPERGLFKQISERSLFKDKPERGLFRQSSDRSLFKKKPGRGLFGNSSDHNRGGLFKQKPDFNSIAEESDLVVEKQRQKPKRRSSDLGLKLAHFREKSDRVLVRRNSLVV